jgi:hypothetical protein
LDIRNLSFPLGVLVGSRILLTHLAVKLSNKGTLYCQGIPTTTTTLLTRPQIDSSLTTPQTPTTNNHDPLVDPDPDPDPDTAYANVRRGRLVDLFQAQTNQIERVSALVRILHVQEVVLWMECGGCRLALAADGSCANRCVSSSHSSSSFSRGGGRGIGIGGGGRGGEGRRLEGVGETKGVRARLQGRAKMYVDDGTLEARVHLESGEAVVRLLRMGGAGARVAELLEGFCGGEVGYRKDPPWFQEFHEEGEGTGGGIHYSGGGGEEEVVAGGKMARLLEQIVEGISQTKEIILTARNFSSLDGNRLGEDPVGKILMEGNISLWNPEYSLTLGDLRSVLIKSGESVCPTLTFPRYNVHGLWISYMDCAVEARRLLNNM